MNHLPERSCRGGGRDDKVRNLVGDGGENPALKKSVQLKPFIVAVGEYLIILKAIEKAIVNSDLGMTPNSDGEVIRLALPQLTSERRKELSKVVARQAEEGKVALRNIRRDAVKSYEKLEKEKKLSEDNVKDLSNDLQKVTDEYIRKIDAIYKQKEKELLTV
ncbi:unnamed protein product [Cuscuta campestris]|uniref:Ribosome-recycling factor, chloroplastic n=1 Tax=Cuscuta campestris TaxID=132261 RepID=A0A484LE96_9ASTE|nr:unnamed protein product [Cuscuta campestris]